MPEVDKVRSIFFFLKGSEGGRYNYYDKLSIAVKCFYLKTQWKLFVLKEIYVDNTYRNDFYLKHIYLAYGKKLQTQPNHTAYRYIGFVGSHLATNEM